MTALKDVQILVFPAAAKVYNECKFISTKLGSLHKHLDANKVLAVSCMCVCVCVCVCVWRFIFLIGSLFCVCVCVCVCVCGSLAS